MQIPILDGIYVSGGEFRTSYPRNYIPVPKKTGINAGYLRPGDGIVEKGTGPGTGRGGISWKGELYRVMGSKLVRISHSNAVEVLGEVGAGGRVSMDYSFDRLAIASGEQLYYWDGSSMTTVTDGDLGTVLDVLWVAGYFMTTDGTSLVVTELNNPLSVNPLKYGSSESDPDPVMCLRELNNEVYAFNRYSADVFQNVGGDFFPFQVIESARINRGTVGTHAVADLGDSFAMVGSGRNEPPAVYLVAPGQTSKISTREIETILQGYTEQQLSLVVVESKLDKAHQHILIHLPDQCLVHDLAASVDLGEFVWFTLDSGTILGKAKYRSVGHVWAYDGWQIEDPTSSKFGKLTGTVSSHFGSVVGWDFGTLVLYNEAQAAILHSLELIGLPGNVAFGQDPVLWTSYSIDGVTWSQEVATRAGKQGQRGQRIQWRKQGRMRLMRIQRFRGTSDCHLPIVRLEATFEALNG